MLTIGSTFIDEISGDIPHQNWLPDDWDRDFAAMRAAGIDSVTMIRCGIGRWITHPSKVLEKEVDAYAPATDLTQLFLDLAEKHGMKFYFGNYNGGFHVRGNYRREIDINKAVCEEAWERYGSHPAFAGWYLTQEVGRLQWNIIEVFHELGKFCKELSGGMRTMISPYIEGIKLYDPFHTGVNADKCVKPDTFAGEWDEIMSGIAGDVDVIAFQDGGCDYHELEDFLRIAVDLGVRHGIGIRSNVEAFDRDMPIRFLPIKWEKMLLKLRAAERAGIRDAVMFEFSHFMSPNSCYAQAHGLYRCYRQYRQGEAEE